ncbi:hypothetical protein BT96DRAFT_994620 [Gymnopus androsaceus JB14]|uniref:Myb/SANT-like domain-containing protein n=1 Tax=Gymnopus androsaceus JB14 TaxID=1447944 RepID=A0A6A4HMR1_9AGAR|nr:hypothetical protein BT96DRAFT_994620 [Gymnopus androsaceus JB14]
MVRTKRKSNSACSKSSTLTFNGPKFKFTPNSITKLITSTLKHKPYCWPHKQKTQGWKAVADDLNNATESAAVLTHATAHRKIESLLNLCRPGKTGPNMQTKFTEEEWIEFSSILDSLYSDYEMHEEEKVKEKGEKDEDKNTTKSRMNCENKKADTPESDTDGSDSGSDGEYSLSTPSEGSTSSSSSTSSMQSESSAHCVKPTGPLHDMLNQFMNVQNHVTTIQHLTTQSLLLQSLEKQGEVIGLLSGWEQSSARSECYYEGPE